jgi:RNA polymerase sigma-70 factor (ECF subfamily)
MGPNKSSEPTDWELAHRAKSGDEAAYAALITRHQTSIHSFIFRSVSDDETAKDLTQEVFVKAWFALSRVREQARFTTWLFQIAVNLCRDHAKSKAARQSRLTHSFVRDKDDKTSDEREFPHPAPSPDHHAELSENLRALDAEMGRLPDDLRSALLLGIIEGLSHKAVARILGVSTKAVEVRIYRARRILTERLSAQGIIPI